MYNQIIRFIEKNVDGCGSDAEVMVVLQTDRPLSDVHKEKLLQEISCIKEEWKDVLWDTDELVNEAICRVFGDNVTTEIILPTIEVEF